MQICDKIKESNEVFEEFGDCYRLLNEEIIKGKAMNVGRVKELFAKKTELWKKREKNLEEISVLVKKLNAEWQIWFNKYLQEE